ncbi:hypothetical protein AK812_SmicGene19670 [Symbiodinium microadriaticum]|uniref:Response regulatory domain-containing protein n=2 Tax=Symbiodinium TaxID=2949 RepID=A0A1Q9DRZ4_SYMMI|nr:hypothetical protein AK812_SmicGene19670 [Symbiodinium microadriaticum]
MHAEVATAGFRSDVPQPRAREPSPMRAVAEAMTRSPVPARDFDVSPDTTDVIYAEDEEVFRETAVRELLKVGFLRQNIREADNGLGALDYLARLQNEGHVNKPLLVLLDVRMPGMDGRECALQIQELVKKKLLRREPYVVCVSSIARQVEVDEGGGNFQIVLPKPINAGFIEDAFEHLRKWWTLGCGRELPAWKDFQADQLDVIAADEEPVCRMSSQMAFVQAGVLQDAVVEVESQEELLEQLGELQAGDDGRPLIILLGQEAWAQPLADWVEAQKAMQVIRRVPFVVCTSVDSDRIGASHSSQLFHALLPRTFTQQDVRWSLEYCRLWWLTRCVGPYQKPSDEVRFDGSGTEEELSEEEDDSDMD